MTKRKRTPSPSPPPRRRVIFEVPQSVWRFQAIARELARQSELLASATLDPKDQQPRDSRRLAPGAPQFDAQIFQNNVLRFSPYSHQPVLPSQPWPEAAKPDIDSPELYSNGNGSAASSSLSRADGARQDGLGDRIPQGPEDQLYDELNDSLNADGHEGAHDPDTQAQAQYLAGSNRITFDPQIPSDWSGMHLEQYQPFVQSYPHPTTPTSQPRFSSTIAHHPIRASSNSILPSSPAHPPPSFYHPQSPPPPPQTGAHTKSDIPGYYKSSLKLWSQAAPDAPALAHSQAVNQFASLSNSYPQLPYTGSTTYHHLPQPVAPAHQVNVSTNTYGSIR
jgi:hypothetical protein